MSIIADTYRNLSDEEIMGIYGDAGALTDEARNMLRLEIDRRGLSNERIIAQQELLIQQRADQLIERRKRPIRWLIMTAQCAIVIALAAIFVSGYDFIHLGGQSGSGGAMIGYATILNLILAMSLLRGSIRGTIVLSLVIYSTITVFLMIVR